MKQCSVTHTYRVPFGAHPHSVWRSRHSILDLCSCFQAATTFADKGLASLVVSCNPQICLSANSVQHECATCSRNPSKDQRGCDHRGPCILAGGVVLGFFSE